MALPQEFENEFGPPSDSLRPTEDTLRRYAGMLPDELLAHWRKIGLCAYGRGLLWLCDPAQFDDIIGEWAPPDSYAGSPPLVFLRTAFAHLYFWHCGWVYSVDVQRADVSQVTDEFSLIFSLLCDPEIKQKILRSSLFEEARPKLGAPARDECYAFEPALALGGPGTVDTLRRVKIREHLGILAQLTR